MMDQVTDILRAIRNLDQRLRTMERSSLGGGSFELPSPLNADTVGGNSVIDILSMAYPVGSIYISVVSTNPNTLLGFGTWSAFATGKTLVGIDSGDTDFDTVEETGGAKTHKHKGDGDADSGETVGSLRAKIGSPYGDAQRIGFVATNPTNPNDGTETNFTYAVPGSASGQQSNGRMSHYTPVVGYTSTKSSLQPYIVVYMWKRTA